MDACHSSVLSKDDESSEPSLSSSSTTQASTTTASKSEAALVSLASQLCSEIDRKRYSKVILMSENLQNRIGELRRNRQLAHTPTCPSRRARGFDSTPRPMGDSRVSERTRGTERMEVSFNSPHPSSPTELERYYLLLDRSKSLRRQMEQLSSQYAPSQIPHAAKQSSSHVVTVDRLQQSAVNQQPKTRTSRTAKSSTVPANITTTVSEPKDDPRQHKQAAALSSLHLECPPAPSSRSLPFGTSPTPPYPPPSFPPPPTPVSPRTQNDGPGNDTVGVQSDDCLSSSPPPSVKSKNTVDEKRHDSGVAMAHVKPEVSQHKQLPPPPPPPPLSETSHHDPVDLIDTYTLESTDQATNHNLDVSSTPPATPTKSPLPDKPSDLALPITPPASPHSKKQHRVRFEDTGHQPAEQMSLQDWPVEAVTDVDVVDHIQVIHTQKRINGFRGFLTRTYQLGNIILSRALISPLDLYTATDMITGQPKAVLRVIITSISDDQLPHHPFGFTFYWPGHHSKTSIKPNKAQDIAKFSLVSDSLVKLALVDWAAQYTILPPWIQVSHILRESLKVYIVYSRHCVNTGAQII